MCLRIQMLAWSLCRYATDPVVNFTIMALIIIGGLGFCRLG